MHKTFYNISRGQVPQNNSFFPVFVEGGACAVAQWHNGQSKRGRDLAVKNWTWYRNQTAGRADRCVRHSMHGQWTYNSSPWWWSDAAVHRRTDRRRRTPCNSRPAESLYHHTHTHTHTVWVSLPQQMIIFVHRKGRKTHKNRVVTIITLTISNAEHIDRH